MSALGERAVKGGNCASALDCLKQRLSADEYRSFLGRLPLEARILCERRILTVEWVPYTIWHVVSDAIFKDVCSGDEERYIRFNRDVAKVGLSGPYLFVLRFLKSENVLQRVARQFSTFNNRGRLDLGPVRNDAGVITVSMQLRDHAPWHCYALSLHGIVLHVLEITGAQDISIQRGPSVIKDGGLDCDYSVRYRAG